MPLAFFAAPYQRSQREHPQLSQGNLSPYFLRTAFGLETFSFTILLELILISFIKSSLEHLSL